MCWEMHTKSMATEECMPFTGVKAEMRISFRFSHDTYSRPPRTG